MSNKEHSDDLKELVDGANASMKNSVKQHNTVFRQMASQLILIAGIFLALSTQIGAVLADSSKTIKLLFLLIVTLLNLSILFGVLQHLMEANFFKKSALGLRAIFEKYELTGLDSIDKLKGEKKQFYAMRGDSVRRWPTYTQMALLAASMLLISLVAALRLYG